jgi:hydrogenase maturation protein HypF
VNSGEERLLSSPISPVVLLRMKRAPAPAVNCGLHTIGALLPYMPFHHLLFAKVSAGALVLTSGNVADNPVVCDDTEAERELGKIADAVVSYNREICSRADDSVVSMASGRLSIIRRARGFVPSPVHVAFNADGFMAMGAEQKNTFCIGKGNQVIVSQHIGDLKGMETHQFYRETIDRFSHLFRFSPRALVCDLHPDYLSTLYAGELAAKFGIPLFRVQHHYAHIASCMAENHVEGSVIGIVLDGTGLGTDGNLWGGEFFKAGPDNFERYAHFEYRAMPGGDKVIEEPWRMALSYLVDFDDLEILTERCGLLASIGAVKISQVCEMLKKNVNTPLTSSAGRLFDAVAAILGISLYSEFDAEAPMRLESSVVADVNGFYPYVIGKVISFSDTFRAIIDDISNGFASVVPAKFHNTIARMLVDVSLQIREEADINKVVLSGGVFQNGYLTQKAISLLCAAGFEVFTQHQVPANDGGICLGQIMVASKFNHLCV